MGQPIDGTSSVPAGAMNPPTIDLARAPPLEGPNAKVTGKMYQQHASSSSSENEEEEEVEDGKEEEEDVDDMFKYHGCSWPEVVGLEAHKAKQIIRKGKPDIYFEVVSDNQILTMCYCSRRVRIVVDRYGFVLRAPHVG